MAAVTAMSADLLVRSVQMCLEGFGFIQEEVPKDTSIIITG